MNDDMCRFSDEKLQEFYEDFGTYKQEFDSHVERFTDHIDKEDDKWELIIKLAEENKASIADHRQETANLVFLYETASAGKRIAIGIGKVATWVASMGVFVGVYHYITKHF